MEIKFRQPIFNKDGSFKDFHYWGVNIDQNGILCNVSFLTFKLGITDPKQSQQYINLKDKNGKEIYNGDIGEVKTDSGRIERLTVDWGIHRRDMKSGFTVDIPSFAFIVDGFPSFPIVNNYLNGHDLDIIEIIGNTYQLPKD